jgi:hypothetical protein
MKTGNTPPTIIPGGAEEKSHTRSVQARRAGEEDIQKKLLSDRIFPVGFPYVK